MRRNLNPVSTFQFVVRTRLPMSPFTSRVGNVHCVGRPATPRLFNKRALNGERGGVEELKLLYCTLHGKGENS